MTTPRKTEPRESVQHGPETLLALSQLALDRMEQGVAVYDSDNRIVLLNRRYLDLFDMSADIVRPGTSYREVLAHSASRGNFSPSEIEALYLARIVQIEAGQPFRTEQRLPNGLVLALYLKPLPEGGWMTICDDVTRLDRLEAELRVQTERSQHALANMSHGLIMFDAQGSVVVCNERFLRLYNLDPDVVKPGTSHSAVIEHWVSRGNMPGMPAEEFHDTRINDLRSKSSKPVLVTCYDGRMVQAVSRFLSDGGCITLHEDVTERLNMKKR